MAAEVTNHGASGYRRGCKCGVCRAGHATYMADWRARRREAQTAAALADAAPLVVTAPPTPPVGLPAALDLSGEPGPIERALLDDLAEPDEKVAFRRHLLLMARLNARILDQVGAIDRLDLVSPLELRQAEILNRIAILGFKGLDDGKPQPSVADEAAKLLEQLSGGSGASGRPA